MSRQTSFLRLGSITALGTLVLAFGARPAEAQSIPSSFRRIETRQEAGIFVGYISPDRGRFGYGPGPGPVVGGRYAVDVSGPFAFEGTLSFLPTMRDVIDPDLPDGGRQLAEADVLMTMIDARLRFGLTGQRTWHGIAPHLLFGGGVAFDAAGAQPDDELLLVDDRFEFGSSFLGVVGAGTRWLPSERLTIRVDGGLTFWQLQTPAGYSEIGRGFESVEEKVWGRGLMLTFGGALRF